ncbi:hypothetical protein JXB31_03150 [Candidatus Woesearchaeota archaeon]|nr:hypothetical protein [Candidatus Woesearchaeota archaeon]
MAEFDDLAKLQDKEIAKKILEFDSAKQKKALLHFRPEIRIRLIRLIESERKKQEEISKQIVRESIEEIEQGELESKAQNPDEAEAEHGRVFKESGLEEQISSEEPQHLPENLQNTQYIRGMPGGVEYAVELYNELAELGQNAAANTSYNNMTRAAELYERLQEMGRYESRSETLRGIAEGSRRIMKQLSDESDYKPRRDYIPGM